MMFLFRWCSSIYVIGIAQSVLWVGLHLRCHHKDTRKRSITPNSTKPEIEVATPVIGIATTILRESQHVYTKQQAFIFSQKSVDHQYLGGSWLLVSNSLLLLTVNQLYTLTDSITNLRSLDANLRSLDFFLYFCQLFSLCLFVMIG